MGQRLDSAHIPEVMAYPPQTVVIGTAFSGCVAVPADTLKALQDNGLEVRGCPTR